MLRMLLDLRVAMTWRTVQALSGKIAMPAVVPKVSNSASFVGSIVLHSTTRIFPIPWASTLAVIACGIRRGKSILLVPVFHLESFWPVEQLSLWLQWQITDPHCLKVLGRHSEMRHSKLAEGSRNLYGGK